MVRQVKLMLILQLGYTNHLAVPAIAETAAGTGTYGEWLICWPERRAEKMKSCCQPNGGGIERK